MRVLLTGIPSYLQRAVSEISGTQVRYRPCFEDVRTRKDLIGEVKKISNTGNYLIGEAAARSLRGHEVTYIPFWHLANKRGSQEFHERLNEEFDICIFVSSSLLRPRYSAHIEAEVFRKLKMPVVVMGIGIQRKDALREGLPAGTLEFLDVLKNKESFFLTRGYFTAEFLREHGLKFVKPVGCPSLFFAPVEMRRSLAALANPDLGKAQKIAFGGYLGSVPDTIVDVHALLGPDSIANYVIQDELIAYNLDLPGDDDMPAYDGASGRIIATAEYKHAEKWQRQHELRVFFDTTQWRTWASTQDFCFGRRFHGCVIGMQAGVPALMIAVDDRMREMLEFIGFPYLEAAIWNRERDKKAYLSHFLSKIDTPAVIERYSACEANFRNALKQAGL